MTLYTASENASDEAAWDSAYYTAIKTHPERRTSFGWFALYACLLAIPALALALGGSSDTAFALFSMATISLLALGIVKNNSAITDCFKARSVGRIALGCLVVLMAYVGLQGAVALSLTQNHEILGRTHRLPDLWSYLLSMQSLLVFSSFFVLARVGIASVASNRRESPQPGLKGIEMNMTIIGIIIAVVGLSHWFSDNGKLFWSIAPEFVEPGTRARWPFVNPNHLAAFLLPLFFIALSRVSGFFRTLVPEQTINSRRRLPNVSSIITDSGFQHKIVRAVFRATFAAIILLAIAATLSRAAWIACGCGLLTLTILQYIYRAPAAYANSEDRPMELTYTANKRRKASRPRGKIPGEDKKFLLWVPTAIKGALFVGALAMFALFITASDGGGARVSERIQFGLSHSMSDIRWLLMGASLKLFATAPLFGVGFGGWREAINPYLPSGLAGLNPVYLHSDPLQFLVEVGLFGVLPLLFLALVIGVRSYLSLKGMSRDSHRRLPLACLVAGMVAILVTATFDFPFRITAVSALFAFYLAFVSVELDVASNKL